MPDPIDLDVPILTRVEGEGALHVEVRDGKVSDVELRIYEPPRFFEALLVDRDFTEPPDLTSRICGICPVAYQMSAVHAIERACGVDVGPELRALRRLLYCGEWIESHVLHIGLLHAPDFLGFPSGLAMGRDHPEKLQSVLRLKQVGNQIVELLGGRSVHPINVRVGGFHHLPSPDEFTQLRSALDEAHELAVDLARWTDSFDYPTASFDAELVSLRHDHEYPMNEGRIVSDRGLDIAQTEFLDHFGERQVRHSTALHGTTRTNGLHLVGPMARFVNNYDRLPTDVAALADEIDLDASVRNPFRSIQVRAIEVVLALVEGTAILADIDRPVRAAVEVAPKAATGAAATEAPRGLLFHRYQLRADGSIATADIVPPTAQNQPAIEEDVRRIVTDHIESPAAEIEHMAEACVRNHDPCISCATHFLRLHIDRNAIVADAPDDATTT